MDSSLDTVHTLIHDTIRQAHAAHETDADTLAHRVTDHLHAFGHIHTEQDTFMYWKSDTTGWHHTTHEHVITITDAAALVGMHPDTLRAAVRRGENVGFPIFKAGRRYTVPKRPLYDMLGITH